MIPPAPTIPIGSAVLGDPGPSPRSGPASRGRLHPGTDRRRVPWVWVGCGLGLLLLAGWSASAAFSGLGAATAPSAAPSDAPARTNAQTPAAEPGSPSPATSAPQGDGTGGDTTPGASDSALVAAPIVGSQSGKCVDVSGGSSADLTRIVLFTCNDSAAQAISYTSAGELRVLGKCLDALNQGRSNGTAVVLFGCNGQLNQKWNLTSDGVIKGVQSNLCLDATAWGTADGTPLQLWECHGGANQSWTN